MTIRNILISLFLLMGLALFASVSAQMYVAYADYGAASSSAKSNSARELLARLSVSVSNQRTYSYLALLGTLSPKSDLAETGKLDSALLDSAVSIVSDLGTPEGRTTISSIKSDIVWQDEAVGRALAAANTGPQVTLALQSFQSYSNIIRKLNSLRSALLAREQPVDSVTSQAFQLRRFSSLVLENLARNRPLIWQMAVGEPGKAAPTMQEQAERNAARAGLTIELLSDQPHALGDPITQKVEKVIDLYNTRYRPIEMQLLRVTSQQLPLGTIPQRWNDSAEEITGAVAELQEALFDFSRARLAALEAAAQRRLLMWVGIMVAGAGTVYLGTRTVLLRLVQPLGDLRASMIRLADGDLETPLPTIKYLDEVGIMVDTLRVFKSNAARRARMHAERLALHDRLKQAYRQLKLDLEAAAAVQEALLPVASRLGGVRFAGLLRPSHFISGDTYDVLRQPNGAVHFFHIDVAGHGAAAALVSVASHSTLTQAVLKRRSGETLAETVARINLDWPEHLPFFTMVLGELNPESGQGVLIQAGHPPPILLRSTGEVEQIGDGGLPVGVISGATYEEVRFSFGLGDRLIVYSDGVTETENPEGQAFSEERLLDSVRNLGRMPTDNLLSHLIEELRLWRSLESFEDDVTVLILEATENADN